MRRTRTYPPRAFLGGLVLLLLSAYLAVLSGFMGETLGSLIGDMLSTDSLTVSIRGLKTDVFWTTTVEEVEVADLRGLVVTVEDARVSGAVHSFALSRHLRLVEAGMLTILLPPHRDDGDTTTLAEILEDIDEGIVTGADTLRLLDGSISDTAGVLLDDMFLDASVSRGRGVVVSAARASLWIRGFGVVSGSGQASLSGGVVSSPGFSASTPPGNLYASGRLRGGDAGIDVLVSGTASTGDLGLPVSVSVEFDGTVTGTLPRPHVMVGLRDGSADWLGRPLEFEVDTLVATYDSLAVAGVVVTGEGISVGVDGTLGRGGWRVEADAEMDRFDPGRYTGTQGFLLDGTARLTAHGTGPEPLGGEVWISLGRSTLSGVAVSSLDASASYAGGTWSCNAGISIPGANALLAGRAGGDGIVPNSCAGRVEFVLEDAGALPVALLPEGLAASGVEGGAAFEGDLRRVSLQGYARMDRFGVGEDVTLGGVEVQGSVTIPLDGGAAGISGECAMRVERLDSPVDTFRLETVVAMSSGVLTADALELQSADGLKLTMAGRMDTGTGALDISGLNARWSKLQLVEDGSCSCILGEDSIALDTLWILTPHGTVAARGVLGEGCTDVEAWISHVDLSPLGSLLHLPGGVSGTGDLELEARTCDGVLEAGLDGRIAGPSMGSYMADSITIDVRLRRGDLLLESLTSWDGGVPSTLTALLEGFHTEEGFRLDPGGLARAELRLNHLGDWVFFALPLPLRTSGADLSARLEYDRDAPVEERFSAEASATVERLFVTSLDMYLSNIILHMMPDSSYGGTRITVSSSDETYGTVFADLRVDIAQESLPDLRLERFWFRTDFQRFRTSVGGFADVLISGYLQSEGSFPAAGRPELSGKIDIIEGLVGMPPESSGEPAPAAELPFDVHILVRGTRGLWFRNSLADIELGVELTIITQDRLPTASGVLTSVRGEVHLLQKDFTITQGTIELVPGITPEPRMSVIAETQVRGAIDRSLYSIVVSLQGPLSSPVITLTGEGPFGSLAQEDILALLAMGITYGELQQMDSGALQAQLGGAAQSYIGQLLARSLREGIGLDELVLTPELLSDSTSLQLSVGKYILPDLFLSYSGDVFSTEPGTISAQYYIRPDLYLIGSTKSTLHGEQEPSLEIHYTLRY
jgi:hypothetical protein